MRGLSVKHFLRLIKPPLNLICLQSPNFYMCGRRVSITITNASGFFSRINLKNLFSIKYFSKIKFQLFLCGPQFFLHFNWLSLESLIQIMSHGWLSQKLTSFFCVKPMTKIWCNGLQDIWSSNIQSRNIWSKWRFSQSIFLWIPFGTNFHSHNYSQTKYSIVQCH